MLFILRLERLALVILRLGLLLAFPVHPICTLQSDDSRNARGWTGGRFRDHLEDWVHLDSRKILGNFSLLLTGPEINGQLVKCGIDTHRLLWDCVGVEEGDDMQQ